MHEQRVVQVVKMGTLTLYEISEDELRLIEAGDPSSVFLNFGIFALSLGVGIGTTLLAAGEIRSRVVFDVLVILTGLGVLAGIVLLFLWRRSAKQTRSVIQAVRERGKTQFTAATVTTTVSGGGEGSP